MKKIYLTFSFLVFLVGIIIAQPASKPTINSRYNAVDEEIELGNISGALAELEELYKDEKRDEAKYKIAYLNYLLRDYRKAEKYFARAYKKYSDGTVFPTLSYEYGRTLKMNGKYDEARTQFEVFIGQTKDEKLKKLAQIELEGINISESFEEVEGVFVDNVGKNVNSRSGDYSPTMDGLDAFYYTSFAMNEKIDKSNADDSYARVYRSERQGDGWTKGKLQTTKINRNGFNIGDVCLSPDGEFLLFTRVELDEESVSTSKLYFSKKKKNGWGAANEVTGINGDYLILQPSFGKLYGNNVLFFVSNQEGGHGGYDIYYANYNDNGKCESPRNLGETINTIGDEITPFYVDGNLYFSSTGHPGLGGYDVFLSTWNGTNWSKPTNLGPSYNSIVDDTYFTTDEDGYNGFLVSNREGTKSVRGKTCCDDIWSVTKEPVIINLLASVFEGKKALSGAKLQLIEKLNDAEGRTEEKTNGGGNDFKFGLKKDMAYSVIISKDGYFGDTIAFNTVGIEKSQDIQKKIYLTPKPPEEEWITITQNEPIRLNNIYYDFDDDKILPDAMESLDYLYNIMIEYPEIIIELGSHTDSQGKDNYNQKLSQRRAKSATDYLLSKGIESSRIKPVGYGESVILNQCVNGVKCSDEEHRINRRTEFKIIAGPTEIVIKKQKKKVIKE